MQYQNMPQTKNMPSKRKIPRIELICIGSELLSSKINTHGVYLSKRLAEIGLKLFREMTVGDELGEIGSAISEALSRSEVVISTGGLGPTFDDLTREAWSDALKLPLVRDKKILKWLAGFFKKRKLRMSRYVARQADLLDGARALPNDVGTAPGQIYKGYKGRSIVILLPGPMNELRGMLDKFILPYLKNKFPASFASSIALHIAAQPESSIDERIRPVIKAADKSKGKVSLTILAHRALVDISVTVRDHTRIEADRLAASYRNRLMKILGSDVYGEGETTLEEAVGRLLRKKKATLAIAESCTGGLIAEKITNVPGSSAYLIEGSVVYSDKSKIRRLNVDAKTIKQYGAVSEQVARQMAKGAQKYSGAGYTLAITGIAGPSGGSKKKPVGLVYISISCPGGKVYCRKHMFHGERDLIRDMAATFALELLRRTLL